MPSLIPRKIRRYKKEYPYSYPALFFFLEMADSLIKLSLIAALLFGGYVAFNRYNQPVSPDTALQTIAAADEQPASAQSDFNPILAERPTEAPADRPSEPAKLAVIETAPEKPLPQILDGNQAIGWIQQQVSSYYLIQFASSPDKDALLEFARDNLTTPSVLYPYKRTPTNRPVYGVASGLHSSMESAQQSLSQLPPELQSYDPWIRPVDKLQRDITSTLN